MKALVEAKLYRDAGNVQRYHVKRTHRQQTVAEHTFGMLMLVKQVNEFDGFLGDRVAVVYDYILHHDLPELMTGDIPAPIKRAHPSLGPMMDAIEADMHPLYRECSLTPLELSLVKWADRMELVLWCLEEVRMGNTYCAATVSRGLGWILAGHVPPRCRALTDQVVADAQSVGIVPCVGAELERMA